MIHKTLDKMFSWCSFSGIVHRSCEIHLEGCVYTIKFSSFSHLQSNPTPSSCAGSSIFLDISQCVSVQTGNRVSERAGAQQDSIHLPSAHSETQRPGHAATMNSLNSLPGLINCNFCATKTSSHDAKPYH